MLTRAVHIMLLHLDITLTDLSLIPKTYQCGSEYLETAKLSY